MRLLLAVLLVGLVLSGCAGKAPEEQLETGEDDQRRSVGGGGDDGNNTDPPHDDVVLLDEPLKLVGLSSASFEVVVPANVTNVDATIASPGMVYEQHELAMTLEACGGFTNPGSQQGTFGGASTHKYRVCTDATSGTHTFTVSVGPASYIEGTLRLVGQIPKANATAPA